MLQVFDKVLHIRYCINQFHLTIVTEMLLKMTLNIHYPALKFDENGTCHVIKHLQDFFFPAIKYIYSDKCRWIVKDLLYS
jgi:hypothetical protein